MKYYDKHRNRLVCIERAATPSFWDTLWTSTPMQANAQTHDIVVRVTRRFLRAPAKILEGGCGAAGVVYALQRSGYDVVGVDTAIQTIRAVKQRFPQLKVRVGNINRLPFDDNSFDGYWSLGVIEHNVDGYNQALQEMWRVTRPKGYLFLTFPAMTPLRNLKAQCGYYPLVDHHHLQLSEFYQYILAPWRVKNDLARIGFMTVYKRSLDGFKGLKDEFPAFTRLARVLQRSNGTIARFVHAAVNIVSTPWAGHIILLVCQKNSRVSYPIV